jgi:CSLREA domain-containing protein
MKAVRTVLAFLGLLSLLVPVLPVGAVRILPAPLSALPSQAAGESGAILLFAAARGNPWIHLRDGEAVPTRYVGPESLTQSLETAHPLALAADDFDEDGMPDLVAGYATADGGLIAVHYGSLDYLWPDGPEADARKEAALASTLLSASFVDAPFLPDARLFPLPIAPDFLGTGDLDNDGHRDVVAAAWGNDALYLLPGDGQGGLGTARAYSLPGAVTAFAAGEVNRRDGLQDLVVGVDGPAGPQLVVFEGPPGALRWEPEVLDLPAPATAVAIGQMDEHYCMDIAVACGGTLVIVQGRDRKLSVSAAARTAVPSAVVGSWDMPYGIVALALGDSIPEAGYVKELALLAADGTIRFLLPATAVEIAQLPVLQVGTCNQEHGTCNLELVTCNVSALPFADLAVLDPTNRQVHLVVPVERGTTQDENGVWDMVVRPWSISLDTAGAPAALLPMRLNPDALSDLVLLQEGTSGPVVAATAPMAAFVVDSTGDDADAILGDGICATSGGVCTLRAAIGEAQASPGANEIAFNIGGGTPSIYPQKWLPSVPAATTILGSTGGAERVEISGSQMGWYDEVLQLGGGNSTVRNLVLNHKYQGQGLSMRYFDGNIVEGCYIGTDKTGTIAYGNSMSGVYICGTANQTIGGTVPAAGNLISGNGTGILAQETTSTDLKIQGNRIGTDASGSLPLGNMNHGVVLGGGNATVGGTEAGAKNVIAANAGTGVWLSGDGALLQGNFIGLNDNGIARRPNNGSGIALEGAPRNLTGGTSGAARNVIAGNDGQGVAIVGSAAAGNKVQGNSIGLGPRGESGLHNLVAGVLIDGASGSVIGGTEEGAGNTIAYNKHRGVIVLSGARNAVQGNSIYANGDLGIDMGGDLWTPNDDAEGEGWQNYPALQYITATNGTTILSGTLHSKPGTTYRVEFFGSDSCGATTLIQGKAHLGAVSSIRSRELPTPRARR